MAEGRSEGDRGRTRNLAPAARPVDGSSLTVEVLGRLPPQGLQAHLGVGPLQHQPPAVQVGAVTQGVEGPLERNTEREQRPTGRRYSLVSYPPAPQT